MIGTGLAILGAGLLGAGASAYAANKASSASKDAANAAAATNNRALDIQKETLDTQRANFADTKNNLSPFINNGVGANNLLGSFYGVNGNALNDNALSRFAESPDYKFALKEGQGAFENSAAAKSGLLGGNAVRGSVEYGQGLATQNLNNYLQRLTGLSQQGLTAGGYLGQFGTTLGNGAGANIGATSNNIANNQMAAGTAEASGILGEAKSFNSGLNALSLYNAQGQSSFKPANSNYLSNYNGNQIGGLY